MTPFKVSKNFMKHVQLADDAVGNAAGWNPEGFGQNFKINADRGPHTKGKDYSSPVAPVVGSPELGTSQFVDTRFKDDIQNQDLKDTS